MRQSCRCTLHKGMMGAMGQGEMTEHRPTCGECGVVIADVEAHTRWHAGADQGDALSAVGDFLDAVDPEELEAAVMAVLDEQDVSPIAATLAVLKQIAAK